MRLNRYKLVAPLLLVALWTAMVVTSCGTKQSVQRTGADVRATLSKRAFLRAYEEQILPPVVDSKGEITLDNGQRRVNSSIRWSLQRDSAFVLSARPMGLMEVLRLTVDRESFALVDRFHRRAFVSDGASLFYQTIEGLTGYDPTLLKHIAQQEPFSLTYGKGVEALRRMDFSADGRHYWLEERDRRRGMTLIHTFSPRLALLESRLQIAGHLELIATYSDYVQLPTPLKVAPVAKRTDLSLRLLGGDRVRTLQLRVELREPKGEFSQKVDTSLPSGYHRLTVQELVEMVRDL